MSQVKCSGLNMTLQTPLPRLRISDTKRYPMGGVWSVIEIFRQLSSGPSFGFLKGGCRPSGSKSYVGPCRKTR
jgi:hypothetical protein